MRAWSVYIDFYDGSAFCISPMFTFDSMDHNVMIFHIWGPLIAVWGWVGVKFSTAESAGVEAFHYFVSSYPSNHAPYIWVRFLPKRFVQVELDVSGFLQ